MNDHERIVNNEEKEKQNNLLTLVEKDFVSYRKHIKELSAFIKMYEGYRNVDKNPVTGMFPNIGSSDFAETMQDVYTSLVKARKSAYEALTSIISMIPHLYGVSFSHRLFKAPVGDVTCWLIPTEDVSEDSEELTTFIAIPVDQNVELRQFIATGIPARIKELEASIKKNETIEPK